MTPLHPEESTARPELLDACRTLIIDRLEQVIAQALASIGEALSAQAMQSQDVEQRALMLDAAMMVRAHAAEIATGFRSRFLELFEERLRPGAQPVSTDTPAPPQELSLVSDDSLADTLQLGRLAQRAAGGLDPDQVLGIRARLAALIDRDWFDERRHPASADAVFESLRTVLSQWAPSSEVRTALLDAFEPYVAQGLNAVYTVVNAHLKAHQVLPLLRPQVQVTGESGRRAQSTASAIPESDGQAGATPQGGIQSGPVRGGPAGQGASRHDAARDEGGHQGAGGWTESTLRQFQQTMQAAQSGLPEGRRRLTRWLSDPGLFESEEAPLAPVGPPLVAALTDLQQAPRGQSAEVTAPQIAQRVRAQGSPLDQITAEIVSIVFDYIYSDRRLPDSVKQQLLRLQVVAVKAALLDRGFFARRQHPLRRLIDRISELGADPQSQTAVDAPLMKGLAEVVDQVIGDFITDLSVFERAILQVDALARQETQRLAQSLEQAAREAARREALELARSEARAALLVRLEPQAPAFLRAFLSRWWSEVLALARCAPDPQAASQAWSVGLRTAEYLIWSAQAKDSEEIARLAAVLPGMMRALNRGLDLIDMPPADRRSFFDDLMQAHTRELEAAKRRTAPVTGATRIRLGPQGTVVYTEPADADAPPAHPHDAPAQPSALSQLIRGQRLELHDDAGTRPFKLAWISPARTLYILSRHPDETLTFDAAQMDSLLSRGRLVLAGGPLTVERAIRRAASDEGVETIIRGEVTQTA